MTGRSYVAARRCQGVSTFSAARGGTSMVDMADTETLSSRRSLPLTGLGEEERMFREQVREFAEQRVRPLVRRMDEEAAIPRELIDACFELGIMGVEIPDDLGGAGATFFMS